MIVVCIKDMNNDGEVCERNIHKSVWTEHLRTRRQGIACGDIVVEKVEKKHFCKCRRHKELGMFSGKTVTCNGCLAHREQMGG